MTNKLVFNIASKNSSHFVIFVSCNKKIMGLFRFFDKKNLIFFSYLTCLPTASGLKTTGIIRRLNVLTNVTQIMWISYQEVKC